MAETEGFFARACFHADQNIGEPAACRYFLNFVDDLPRDEMQREMQREMLAEVNLALAQRTEMQL